jgi:hypothetical protein
MRCNTARIGAELQDELEARSGCRYGLKGVPIRIRGHPGTFVIASTRWDAARRLVLTAYPAGSDRPRPWGCIPPGRIVWGHLLAYRKPTYPPGTLTGIPATDCTLAGRWPVVCCRPRRPRRSREALYRERLDRWASREYGVDWRDSGDADEIAWEFDDWLDRGSA